MKKLKQSDFIDKILEASERVKAYSKPVFGVGINDVNFRIGGNFNGRKINHRAYSAWMGIFERCYSEKKLKSRPTYNGCFVGEEWIFFSNFFRWWKNNHVDGWHIDKDLLLPGNKEYCAERCVYIPAWLNTFSNEHAATKGEYPIGVTYEKESRKFKAKICHMGKHINLSRYSNPIDAHNAWFKEKIRIAKSYKDACDSIHQDLYHGLIAKIQSMHIPVDVD